MFSKYDYVYMVYKEGSFTKAAEKLYISQPSLSAAIKNIEKKLGASIFERTGHGIELTEVGKEYIVATERIIEIENEFKNKLNDIYNLESGHIRVGGSNYLSSYVLPQIINRFTSLHPNISVTLVEANSCSLSKMAMEGEVDIFLENLEDVTDFEEFPLVREKVLLCVPKESKINCGLEKYQILPESIHNNQIDLENVGSVSIDVFRNEKFILLKNGNDMYTRAMKIFEKKNIEPKVAFSVDQLNMSYALADSGIGICFVTDTFFKYGKYHENVVLYNITEELKRRTLYIAYKRNKYCSKAMKEFINVAKEVIN